LASVKTLILHPLECNMAIFRRSLPLVLTTSLYCENGRNRLPVQFDI